MSLETGIFNLALPVSGKIQTRFLLEFDEYKIRVKRFPEAFLDSR
jgi:hypothetical protein